VPDPAVATIDGGDLLGRLGDLTGGAAGDGQRGSHHRNRGAEEATR